MGHASDLGQFDHTEVAAIEGISWSRDKKNFIRFERKTAFPTRQSTMKAVETLGPSDQFSADKNIVSEATNH